MLVVDEVHAYDEYVTGLLDTLLRFQAAQGGSAILLSATLPQRLRQRLVEAYAAGSQRALTVPLVCGSTAFPLATQFSDDLRELALPARDGTQRRTEVQFVASEAEVLQRIDAATSAGGCVLWVRNTVNDAIAAYDQLVRQHGAERVTLFHARFAICDRAEREADVLTRFGPKSSLADRRGRIVVATQVAEQSLDVDFDLVVSDLAPVESLIQRAGRCMRHLRPDRPWAFTAPTLVLLAPRGETFPSAAPVSSGSCVESSDTARCRPKRRCEMFLSRATVRDRNILRQLAGGPYAIHQLVWSLFADDPDRKRDFLFRELENKGLPSFLILSERQPLVLPGWQIETKPFAPELAAGDRLGFSLRANPVVRRRDAQGKQSRHDVVMDAKRRGRETGTLAPRVVLAHDAGRAWLLSRQENIGIQVDEATLRVDGYQVRRFEKGAGSRRIHVATLDFTGTLTVCDPQTLLDQLRRGIGPSKSFGCGLLLLRRG